MSKLDIARLSRLIRENLWLASGALISIVGSLALVRLLTQYLSPTQYGELALALTIANLINQVVMCGLISGIGRFYSIAKNLNELSKYLSESYALLRYAALVTLGIGLLLFSVASTLQYGDWTALIFVTVVFSIISNYNGVFGDIQNAARNRSILVINSSLDTIFKIVITYFVATTLNISSTLVMCGYVVAATIIFISNQLFLKRAIFPQQSVSLSTTPTTQKWTQKIWSYAWPFSVWGIFTWMQQASDRWALQIFSTTEDVGVYAVLFQLGYAPIIMSTGLLSSFLTPIFFSRAGDLTNVQRNASVHAINRRVSYVILSLTGMAFSATLFFHDFIFMLLVSSEFRANSYLLPWFVLAGGLFSTGQMLVLKVLSEARTQILLTVKIGTAILGVTLNILGAWVAGISGVVIALVVFSLAYFIGMFLLTQSKITKKIKKNDRRV